MQWKNSLATVGLTILGLFLFGNASVYADSKAEIDANVDQALEQFYALSPKNRELVNQAAGMLVFPHITKGGVGVGGEYGEGVLRVNNKTTGYYSIVSASLGLTLGVERRSEVILFMNKDVLNKFKSSEGYKIGIDAGVALVSLGAGGQYDTKTLQKPILGFVYDEKGLMGDLSLEGSKITKIEK